MIFSLGGNLLKREKIDRINELADEEIAERELLRREYLDAVRANFKRTLDSIEITDKGE